MKRILIIVGALLAVVALILAVAFGMTAGVTKAADTLFAAIAAGDVDRAYRETAKGFQAATTLEEFRSFLESSALLGHESARWNSRSISGDTGELEGTVRTRDGGTLPLHIELVKEAGAWRVLSIRRSEAGIADAEQPPPLPTRETLAGLCRESLTAFADAVRACDFSDFHASISRRWQAEITPDQLRESFQAFCDREVDIVLPEGIEPDFVAEPALNSDDALVLQGSYPTSPLVLHFELEYEFESPEWKLIRIRVDMREP